MCCTLNIHILNGRLFEDREGNITCISGNGASVVDYSIVSTDLFPLVTDFEILTRDESDHFPIKCSLGLQVKHHPGTKTSAQNLNGSQEIFHKLDKYYWKEEKKDLFVSTFTLKCNLIYDELLQLINLDTAAMISKLNHLYTSTAEDLGLKSTVQQPKPSTPYKQPEWWDQELQELKCRKYLALKTFRKINSPDNLKIYKEQKQIFKHTCWKKKNTFRHKNKMDLVNARKNPRTFWKLLKSNNTNSSNNNNISGAQWVNHFSKLLKGEDNFNYSVEELNTNPCNESSCDILNSEISEQEIKEAISKINVNKAPGPDGIIGNFIVLTKHTVIPILSRLFNRILTTGIIPYQWTESIICPLHKTGDINDPNNYRGISLINVMYKVFSSILNTRLCNWAFINNQIDESQAGFRKNYSPVDNMFIMHALIQKYLSKKRGRLYIIFIDYEKAFDNVSHKVLFEILARKGVCCNFLKILLNIYKRNNSCVKVNSLGTGSFPCSKGTRQGDLSSPMIFDLFINDICTYLRTECNSGIFVTENIPKIISLMFADDVASPADTVVQLQRQINSIEKFSTEIGMKINLSKTNVVVFRNGGPLRKNEKWYFHDKPITISSFYKYMGLIFTPKLKWTRALFAQAAQAKKSLNCIRAQYNRFGSIHYNDFFKIFDAMVKPILCYGAELWGFGYRDTVEKIQISACKQFLGVTKRTSNLMVLGECGRFPLCLEYYVKFIKYWLRIIQMPSHRYPKQCYLMLKRLDDDNRHTYASEVRNLLFSYGYGYVWIAQDVGDINLFILGFKQRLKDSLHQEWHNSLSNSGKGQFYTQFKSLLNVEFYLSFDLPFYLRKALAKFRCSDHNLNIEVGRHYNAPREERLCTYCLETFGAEAIEDEYHVFFLCHRYDFYRKIYIGEPRNKTYDSFFRFMSNPNQFSLLNISKFVHKILQIRNEIT